MNRKIKRLIPFGIFLFLVFILYWSNAHHILNMEWLRREKTYLQAFAAKHPGLSPLLYCAIYIISVALVIPDSTILTLLGTIIFPFIEGFLLALISETIGLTLFFSIFRAVFKSPPILKGWKFIEKLQEGFQKHSAIYLLFLRVSHIVPFWLTNLAAAYFRINYWTFLWTTFIGVIPWTYIIASAGHSVSKVFEKNQTIGIEDIFTPTVKVALLALAFLSFFPIIWNSLKKNKS